MGFGVGLVVPGGDVGVGALACSGSAPVVALGLGQLQPRRPVAAQARSRASPASINPRGLRVREECPQCLLSRSRRTSKGGMRVRSFLLDASCPLTPSLQRSGQVEETVDTGRREVVTAVKVEASLALHQYRFLKHPRLNLWI